MPLDLSRLLTETPQEPHWVANGMLPRGTLVVLAGDAGVGKSFLSYTLAFSVAAGLPFLGRRVEQTRVLYVDEENSLPDLQAYLRWVWLGVGRPDITRLSQFLHVEHFTLGRQWQDQLTRECLAFRPGLIIVDTATSALKIQDENDNAEAARVISGLHQARAASHNDATVLVLKHAKVLEDTQHRRTVRGAKVWLGQADAVWFHHAKSGRPRKDGLRPTVLEPDKVRAWGLREGVSITPEWTTEEPRGIKLIGQSLISQPAK
ncbi:MAG TPA: AAA family ATPase [Dehalococcoidia bacterium]|nr:AAA family ATPase [Dehalococcoidia bacterium]